MLHVLHDLFSFARRPAGPPNLHATYATRLFRLPSSPRWTPDFTCYKCYATFRCSFYMLHVLCDFSHAHGPSAHPPFYMLHMLSGVFRFLHARAGAASFHMLPMLPALFRLLRQKPPFSALPGFWVLGLPGPCLSCSTRSI